jgi:hypothetical protein
LDARTLQAPEALQHISYTHPFAHRPLVEFMLTIPPAEVCRPGEPRRLMRRAFAHILPPAILQRKSKATYADHYRQALIPLAARMLSQPDQIRLVTHGYADRHSVTERLTRFLQGLDCNEPQLRQLLLFEFWLRNREGRANSSSENRPPRSWEKLPPQAGEADGSVCPTAENIPPRSVAQAVSPAGSSFTNHPFLGTIT